jgi:hypothetical protein
VTGIEREERTLELAEEVAGLVRARGQPVAVIGAIAAAVHGYARATADVDLATDFDPFDMLEQMASELRGKGYDVRVVQPDADDPLGGVMTVRAADCDPVQIVNYYNPLRSRNPMLAREALENATPNQLGTLAVVQLPHLIALKLYASGAKSRLDVVELLARHPELDLDALRSLCRRHHLEAELDGVLRLMAPKSP